MKRSIVDEVLAHNRRVPTNGQGQRQAQRQVVNIAAPNFGRAVFEIRGTSPLVVHRFSKKLEEQMLGTMREGKSAKSKVKREPVNTEELFQLARYISPQGWDGFNAAAVRCAMIDVCRLVNFKMTLAKMSIFVEADGWDKLEPQKPLVRIYGKAVEQHDWARVSNGQPYITIRAAYHNWRARVRIRWDADQFSLADVTNLLARVGSQAGLCEGRDNSKNSAGMGWGRFEIEKAQ